MAAGEVENRAVARGIAYLIRTQDEEGNWDEPWFTAVGFPRVFYLRYHGYRAFFPLWALARYRSLTVGKTILSALRERLDRPPPAPASSGPPEAVAQVGA